PAELEKRPRLQGLLGRMPAWLTLPRLKGQAGKSVYRRVLAKGDPDRFIIVESRDLVDWFRGGDDLEKVGGKPMPKLRGNFPGGFFALCGDGQVRFLAGTLPEKEVRRVLVAGSDAVRPLRCKNSQELAEDIRSLSLGQ